MTRPESKSLDQVEKELAAKDKPATTGKRDEPKELEVRRDPNGLYRICFTAGGETPDKLKGRWTSISRANEAIELHKSGRL